MRAANDEFTDSLYDPFPAQITAVAVGTGAQAGMNLYAWREQEYDITTGKFRDAVPGRSGTTSSAYALEVNNQVVPPLPAYVMMRCMGAVNGNLTYLFQSPLAAGANLLRASAFGATQSATTVPGNNTLTLIDCSSAFITNVSQDILAARPDGWLDLVRGPGVYQFTAVIVFLTGSSVPSGTTGAGSLVINQASAGGGANTPLFASLSSPTFVFPTSIVFSNFYVSTPHVLAAFFASQTSGADLPVSVSFEATYVGQ